MLSNNKIKLKLKRKRGIRIIVLFLTRKQCKMTCNSCIGYCTSDYELDSIAIC